MKFLAAGLGGALGSLLRYFISQITIETFIDSAFPWATLLINLLGSYLLGLFMMATNVKNIPKTVHIFLATGLLGSFTTFSTFSVETIALLESHFYIQASMYIGISVIGGLGLAALGFLGILRKGDTQ